MNIYFSRPIAAGTELEPVYQHLARLMIVEGHTFTNPFVVYPGQWNSNLHWSAICERDYKAVKEADLLVWEASVPSNGCALEAAYAHSLGIPVVVLYNIESGKPLSAMVGGDERFYKQMYDNKDDLVLVIRAAVSYAATYYQRHTTQGLLEAISGELERARQKHRQPIASIAEAYAVIFEELDEFWDEVRAQHDKRSPENMRKELIQVAAMCLRTIEDCGL